jgi:hypothetical protein
VSRLDQVGGYCPPGAMRSIVPTLCETSVESVAKKLHVVSGQPNGLGEELHLCLGYLLAGTRVLSSLAEEMAKGVSGGTRVLKNIL